jgi:hypothetical protein
MSFSQFLAESRLYESQANKTSRKIALREQKHIFMEGLSGKDLTNYEVVKMREKARQLPNGLIADLAYQASKKVNITEASKAASLILFSALYELHQLELNESTIAGDASGDVDLISKGETSGAITSPGPKTITKKKIKDKLKAVAVANLHEAEHSDWEEPSVPKRIVESTLVKVAGIAGLVKSIRDNKKSLDSLHKNLVSTSPKGSSIISKIRKAKASGDTNELLQIIAGVLAYQISGSVAEVNINKRTKRD